MVSATGILATATILNNARKYIMELSGDVKDATGKTSLASYTRPCIIPSRAYIDSAVSNEPVVTDILKVAHKLYIAFILNALQMNRLVTKDRTVQDMLRVVSTEAYTPFENIASAFESFEEKKESKDFNKEKKESTNISPSTGKIISIEDGNLPTGTLVEVTLTNPENTEANLKLNILVQMIPYIVSENIAYKLITLDTLPTLYQRYLQWRTGEIDFWKDFIFNLDLSRQRNKITKEDTDGVLSGYLTQQSKERGKLIGNLLAKRVEDRSRNIANSVVIMSQGAMANAKLETGIDFKDPEARQRYFAKSSALFVIIVNTMYNTVTMYYNGLDQYGTYSFDQLKSAAKKGDTAVDIITAMSAYNRGGTPKF